MREGAEGLPTILPVIEAEASRAGWTSVAPSSLRGVSGVEHSFDFVGRGGGNTCAIDVREFAAVPDVISAFVRMYDTGATVSIVCLGGETGEDARKLAKEYGVNVVEGSEVPALFSDLLPAVSVR